MTDYSARIALIAAVLTNDDTISGLVDGQVISGIQVPPADPYLTKTNQCCISVYTRIGRSMGLPGAAFHGMAECDHLICIDVHSISDSDTYASQVAGKIEDLLRKCVEDSSYQINVGAITWRPIRDPSFGNRIIINGTVEGSYLG